MNLSMWDREVCVDTLYPGVAIAIPAVVKTISLGSQMSNIAMALRS